MMPSVSLRQKQTKPCVFRKEIWGLIVQKWTQRSEMKWPVFEEALQDSMGRRGRICIWQISVLAAQHLAPLNLSYFICSVALDSSGSRPCHLFVQSCVPGPVFSTEWLCQTVRLARGCEKSWVLGTRKLSPSVHWHRLSASEACPSSSVRAALFLEWTMFVDVFSNYMKDLRSCSMIWKTRDGTNRKRKHP